MKQAPKNIEDFMDVVNEIDRNKFNILSLHDWHPEDTDWKISVEEHLKSRINAWLDVITLSDHNTLDTNIKAINLTEKKKSSEFYNKLKIIPSIELSLWGKFPGHLIFLDFDMEEFSTIFYEKYIFEYLRDFYENRDKISKELMWKIKWWDLKNFQPSQIKSSTDTALIFEAMIAMKKDSAYRYIIFPGDTPREVFDKLLFHFEKWNIKKFPIIQVPHPTLWKKIGISKPIAHFLGKHVKSLDDLWLTTYWWLISSEESKAYLINELKSLKNKFEKGWNKLNILFEVHNDKDIADEWTSMENFPEFNQIWAIACTWFDWHEEKTPTLWLAIPKWVKFRDYIESENFIKNNSRFTLTHLEWWAWTKKLTKKIKEMISDIIFMQRWNTDPVCNEFINLDPEIDNPLTIFHTINSLDWETTKNPESSDLITNKTISKYKKIQKRWKSAKKLQKIFIKSKDIKD